MMRFLKRHGAARILPVEDRKRRLGLIRWLYLGSIIVLIIWLFDLFFGGLFYLRSDGLVVGQPGAIAAEYPITVRELAVREGDVVKAGQVAAIGSSQNVAETIARLTSELAVRQGRLSELRVRSHVVNALMPLAENRLKVATHAREEMHRLLDSGLTALNQRTAAVELEYRAKTDLATLSAEKKVLDKEISSLTVALGEATKALTDLRRLYDGGRLRVPLDGVIGRRLASTGSVMRAGEPLFEVYGNNLYILAYLPSGTLYTVKPGDPVRISTGLDTYRGTVKSIEPYAAALPHEFQRAFRPVERQQLMRVEFDRGTTPPPVFTKVWLTSTRLAARWFDAFLRKVWPT